MGSIGGALRIHHAGIVTAKTNTIQNMSPKDNTRAVGQLAALEYLKGRKHKPAPMVLVKCPAMLPKSLLFRLFSPWYGVTITAEGRVLK